MSNKDNVFIAVNEEVSSLIQQYIIIEIKRVLDKYKSGLMSIFWTQKVKLFYAALLANNSHCSGVM